MKCQPKVMNVCLARVVRLSRGVGVLRGPLLALGAAVASVFIVSSSIAGTNTFFDTSQTATLIVSNINAITIQSGDYRFTYSADGYWSSGGGAADGTILQHLLADGRAGAGHHHRANARHRREHHAQARGREGV